MESRSTDILLVLRNVHRTFSAGEAQVRALDGISLAIESGEFVAIVGRSGSGKSTLMNIIGCLDTPNSGDYLVRGVSVQSLKEPERAALRRNAFGFVFQKYNLLALSTATGNVAMPAAYSGVKRFARESRAQELLAKLDLSDRAHHLPSELSGGQQQRVAIARALIQDPDIILADEPTGALDTKNGAEVLGLLKELHGEGKTIILITHDEEIAAHAKRIITMKDGKIVSDLPAAAQVTAEINQGNRAVLSAPQLTQGELSLLDSFTEAASVAFESLRANIFRTALTLLGIIIGVAAVVVMLAVGSGSKRDVLKQISAMGTNLLTVRPGAPGLRGAGDVATLVSEDAEAIRDIPGVVAVSPERNSRITTRFGNKDYQATVQGVTDSLPTVRDWAVAEGQFFSDRDVKGYAPVAVIGQTIVKNIFPEGTNPIGKYILIKNVPFQVIGVMVVRGASPFGTDQDDVILVPLSTGIIRLFGRSYLSSLSIKLASSDDGERVMAQATEILKERHGSEDFSIRNMASLLETASATQDTLSLLLGAVAAISLLVGGIGVMNIMLVSVTERTREIGIRVATGARTRDILLQFNVESAVLGACGGVIGVAFGWIVALVLEQFGISIVLTFGPPVISFSCAFMTGMLFGYLPARKAARLDPVLALAAE